MWRTTDRWTGFDLPASIYILTHAQFLSITPLGAELAWRVMKLWMRSAGRSLTNYQWRCVANALDHCTLPIFCKVLHYCSAADC